MFYINGWIRGSRLVNLSRRQDLDGRSNRYAVFPGTDCARAQRRSVLARSRDAFAVILRNRLAALGLIIVLWISLTAILAPSLPPMIR